MIIEYYKKNVYGVEYMYVKDKDKAEIIRTLTGQKTLSASAVKALEQLGHELVQVLP